MRSALVPVEARLVRLQLVVVLRTHGIPMAGAALMLTFKAGYYICDLTCRDKTVRQVACLCPACGLSTPVAPPQVLQGCSAVALHAEMCICMYDEQRWFWIQHGLPHDKRSAEDP